MGCYAALAITESCGDCKTVRLQERLRYERESIRRVCFGVQLVETQSVMLLWNVVSPQRHDVSVDAHDVELLAIRSLWQVTYEMVSRSTSGLYNPAPYRALRQCVF